MRVRGVRRLARSAQWVRNLSEGGSLILLYHRIAEPAADPFDLCITPQHFSEHLEQLLRDYRIISLTELTRMLAGGTAPRRAVVLTFDDGYADNFQHAKPLLERYDAPATVFVTSGYVGQDREFWWDELEHLLLLSPGLPERLDVSLSGRIHSWAVGGSTDGETPERLCVFDELYALLQPLDHVVRDEVLSQLRNQIKRGSVGHTACRPMTGEEVCKLDEGGLVRVGAHTVTHPVLSAHPPEIQLREIRDSKEALERMLGRPVTSLSYPFGGAAAVGPVAPRLAQQMGFDVACSTMHRCVRRGADRYGLPRFAIRNWDGDEFARRLRGFRAGQ